MPYTNTRFDFYYIPKSFSTGTTEKISWSRSCFDMIFFLQSEAISGKSILWCTPRLSWRINPAFKTTSASGSKLSNLMYVTKSWTVAFTWSIPAFWFQSSLKAFNKFRFSRNVLSLFLVDSKILFWRMMKMMWRDTGVRLTWREKQFFNGF